MYTSSKKKTSICFFELNIIIKDNRFLSYVTFNSNRLIPSDIPPDETTLNRNIIALPVGTTVVMCISIGIVLHIKHKGATRKNVSVMKYYDIVNFNCSFSGTEDELASDTQGESVENRLYQSDEFQNPNTRRQEHEVENLIASSSHDYQLYQMQIENRNNAKDSGQSALSNNEHEHTVGYIPQITESDLNYSEIVFEERQSSSPLVIHGIDERTIYSDIVVGAQLSNQLPNNDSSSESEDDFIYVDGIENYTERRKMNASLK
ncbi:unnamed protein product [Mytilus coruscus]|uniref:Uncharacterized protein n=1 Tax=Mytilus coruscus TaxID=42192 RepID=A0A6J8B9P9_MYTCO|nr:unnamed protein product [Mytilus coruscus]